MNWKELNKNIYANIPLRRSNKIEEKYKTYSKSFRTGNDLEKKIINEYLNNKLYAFMKNKFKYNVNKNISHYILWINPLLKNNIIYNKKFVKKILNKKIDTSRYKYIYFMNQKKNRSIQNIPHYQVFITKI